MFHFKNAVYVQAYGPYVTDIDCDDSQMPETITNRAHVPKRIISEIPLKDFGGTRVKPGILFGLELPGFAQDTAQQWASILTSRC